MSVLPGLRIVENRVTLARASNNVVIAAYTDSRQRGEPRKPLWYAQAQALAFNRRA
jgi:hypothetical protein